MFSRRELLQYAGAAAAATQLAPGAASAAGFPDHQLRVLITTAPGGSSDICSRIAGQFMAEKLGQPFIMDNRPGAGGNIAAEIAAKAPADGYTIFSISKGNIFANLLYDNLTYDFMRDFEPVGGIATGGLVMLMHPSVPARNLSEFIAYAKANPTKINYGTPGNGSDPHLSSELLKMMTGIEMTHVPFRGGALALNDLIAGGVQIMFSNLPVADFIKEGKLIGLGVTAQKRMKEYPDLPAIGEVVPGYEVGIWYAFVARRGTPPEAIAILNGAMNTALADPKVQSGIGVLNALPMPGTPAQLGKLFDAEYEKWAKVIKSANIKPG